MTIPHARHICFWFLGGHKAGVQTALVFHPLSLCDSGDVGWKNGSADSAGYRGFV